MGLNYSFYVKNPPPNGSVMKIVHDKFSYTCGLDDDPIPANLLRLGETVKVINTVNLYQSRPNFEPITVSKVMFKNGDKYDTDVYMTKNLGPHNNSH